MSGIFFIATKHPEYADMDFPVGSTVIDPWRYVPGRAGVRVKAIGENKPPMISLLVPSRGRPGEFRRLVDSAWATATFPGRVEVVAYLDSDDPDTVSYPYRSGLSYITGDRILLSECWNRCAERARGEILMHCGDDIVFRTPAWDSVVRKTFAESADKILLVHGDDCSPNTDALATHGFMHRRWYETLGYLVPPLFSSDWNDVWLTEVADMIGRRVKVPIVTEHMHYGFGKAEYDTTYRQREMRGLEDNVVTLYRATRPEREADAEKLRAVMA